MIDKTSAISFLASLGLILNYTVIVLYDEPLCKKYSPAHIFYGGNNLCHVFWKHSALVSSICKPAHNFGNCIP